MADRKNQIEIEETLEEVQKINHDEWLEKGKKLFGADVKKWKFVCPNCGNVQSIEDFEKINKKNPQNYVMYSCIGRYIQGTEGTIWNKKKPCDYTNGGLFGFYKLVVVNGDGEKLPVFEFAE